MQLLSFVPLAAGLISSAYLALQLASAPGPLSSRFATRVIAFGSAMAAISALASGIVADLSAGRTLLFLLEVVTLAALGFDCGVIVNRDSVLAVRRLVTSMPWSQNLGHRVSSASSTLQSPGPPAVNQVGLAQSLGSHTLATGAELEQSRGLPEQQLAQADSAVPDWAFADDVPKEQPRSSTPDAGLIAYETSTPAPRAIPPAQSGYTKVAEAAGVQINIAAPQIVIAAAPATGPGCIVQALWFLVVGWWLSGLVIFLGYAAMLTIVGIPVAFVIFERMPAVVLLRGRTKTFGLQTRGGTTYVQAVNVPQLPLWQRALYFLGVGWWFGGIWLSLAWVLSLLIFTLPIAMLMYGRTSSVMTLLRY